MLVKKFNNIQLLDSGGVGEIVCWREKTCSFTILCMLVKTGISMNVSEVRGYIEIAQKDIKGSHVTLLHMHVI